MPGVAYKGATIAQSIRDGYVTYDIWKWEKVADGYCEESDPNPPYACIKYIDPKYDWVPRGTGSSGAKVDGYVVSSSNVHANGIAVSCVGDTTTEQWVADPTPIPSDPLTEYRNIRPSSSGTSNGSVTFGNSRSVYVNNKSVAIIGSNVTTGVGTTTTIKSGSSNVFIG